MKSRQAIALIFGICHLLGQLNTCYCSDEKDEGGNWETTKTVLKYGTVAVVGGGVAIVGAPVVLGAAGFTQAGIAAGSVAAKVMSASAVANGGGVAASGLVATLQSVGAAGLGSAATAAVGAVGSAVGAGVTYLGEKCFGK